MTAQQALTLIDNLRHLEEETGVKSTRLQGKILQNLSDSDLLRVAHTLHHRKKVSEILAGRALSVDPEHSATTTAKNHAEVSADAQHAA